MPVKSGLFERGYLGEMSSTSAMAATSACVAGGRRRPEWGAIEPVQKHTCGRGTCSVEEHTGKWLLSRHKWQDVRVRAAQGTSYVDWGAGGLTIGLAREREG
jgi:hypothetical protein